MTLADRTFQRILLVKLSAVGDVVHTIPVLNALRRRYPQARIDWLLKPSVASLVRAHPAVSNVLVYGENQTEVPRYNWDGVTHFVGQLTDSVFLRLLRNLRAANYDLVVDMHGQMRTAFVTLVTGAPVRIGFDRPRRKVWEAYGKGLPEGTIGRAWKGAREGSWMAYTHHIGLETLDLHAVDRYQRVGRLLGFADAPPDFYFPVPPASIERLDALLESHGIAKPARPIVISPTALWETKRWLPQHFAAVARHFLAEGHNVVLIGSTVEQAECRAIAEAAPGAIDLSGQTSLLELAALIGRSAVCLTNDSGPMHMAVALGKPVVSVFGPTHPVWVGPYRQSDAVLNAKLACSPCYVRPLSRCPHAHACMHQITPDAVIARMSAKLAAGSVAPAVRPVVTTAGLVVPVGHELQ